MNPQEKQFLVAAYELIRDLAREVDDLHDSAEALRIFETERILHAPERYEEILSDVREQQSQNQLRRERLRAIERVLETLRRL